MNGQISKQNRFTAVQWDVLSEQISLNPYVVALIGMVLVGASNLWAGDLHVPAEYVTIQAAVDAAASGDTIHIAPGVCLEQVFIKNKNLILIGAPGTILGVATNATLIDNRFCNVNTNYNFQPLTTYDLQSTLMCSEPTLDVVEAILLSWPFAYDGYSVESADSPDGPWTALDATVFMQNGMHSVVVPADG